MRVILTTPLEWDYLDSDMQIMYLTAGSGDNHYEIDRQETDWHVGSWVPDNIFRHFWPGIEPMLPDRPILFTDAFQHLFDSGMELPHN